MVRNSSLSHLRTLTSATQVTTGKHLQDIFRVLAGTQDAFRNPCKVLHCLSP